MKTKPVRKPAKVHEGVLVDMARTIGTTLGTLAAKTRMAAGTVSSMPSPPARVRKTRAKAAKRRAKRKA
ncbi:MAG TPA: hypothetical protein VKV15_14175 [Bryobacteraceae bacterium]|nr:hypothetical protein [Bryobacteraceae bacterium]